MYLHYMRSGQYKYCFEILSGNELLFDLDNDPYEQHNLAKHADYVETVLAMRSRIQEHIATNQLQNSLSHDPGVARSDQNMPSNVHPGHWSGRL
jgi:arylsulfatase A-like enzyme